MRNSIDLGESDALALRFRLSGQPQQGASPFDVLSAVNDGDSLLCQQLAPLITSVDSCC